MGLDQDILMLSRVPLFQGFPEEQLRLIAFSSKRIFKLQNEIVFRENEISKGGYIIADGQLDLVVTKGTLEVPVGSFLKNAIVSEMSLISANRCVTTAIARTKTELIFVPRELFQRMLEEYPELAALLHSRISKSVQELVAQMENVQQKMLNVGSLSTNINKD